MSFISVQDKQRITAAIREVESRTSGELVTILAKESDNYYYIPTLWAAMSALLLPALVILFGWEFTLLDSFGAQVSVFLLASLLFRIPVLKYRLVPNMVKRHHAARLAREQFLLQNLHHTEGRTGVMLFVSVAERYVEVIADKGINDLVDPGVWDSVVSEFVSMVKQRKIADGFIAAVLTCGEHLERHFPRQPKDRNELQDHLIEI